MRYARRSVIIDQNDQTRLLRLEPIYRLAYVQCTRAPPAFLILFIYLETENNINKVGAARFEHAVCMPHGRK